MKDDVINHLFFFKHIAFVRQLPSTLIELIQQLPSIPVELIQHQDPFTNCFPSKKFDPQQNLTIQNNAWREKLHSPVRQRRVKEFNYGLATPRIQPNYFLLICTCSLLLKNLYSYLVPNYYYYYFFDQKRRRFY